MHTILGSTGAIGTELAKELTQFTNEVRLVSRNPKSVTGNEELLSADLLDKKELYKAVEGSEVVYLTVGFPYSLKAWKAYWPSLMNNLIDSCALTGTRMVFFDNIYMYDPQCLGHLTEDCPHDPPSEKGKVRAELVRMIYEAIDSRGLKALIARSADFYGPGISQNSMLNETLIKPLSAGKTANWLGKLNCLHSFTYTPDAAKATAILGNTSDAFGETWHLPTASDPWTARKWLEEVASYFKVEAKVREVPKWMVRMIGLFEPIMREMPEMMYQFETDYIFDSSKFERKFNFQATSYETGLSHVLQSDYPN